MTIIPTTIRFARISLIVALLGAGLLVASAQPGMAGEIAPTQVSTTPSQAQSVPPSARQTIPASSSTQDMCPVGMAGFGWG